MLASVAITAEIADPSDHDLELSHGWERLLNGRVGVTSPFHLQEWVATVAEVLPSTQVVVHRDGRDIVAIWPMERLGRFDAGPVGRNFGDHQIVLVAPSVEIGAPDLLRMTGCVRWRFDHLTDPCHLLSMPAVTWEDSPVVELSSGLDPYRAMRKARGSRLEGRLSQARQKLERTSGPLRFEPETRDPSVLARLLQWKSEQYRATGVPNALAEPWSQAFLHNIFGQSLLGMALSALWAGDRLVAAHLGLRTKDVWHYWLPAYDVDHAAGSPGMVLLEEIINSAAAADMSMVDLGRGMEHYKTRVANGAIRVGRGEVRASGVRSAAVTGARALRRRLRRPASPLTGRAVEAQ